MKAKLKISWLSLHALQQLVSIGPPSQNFLHMNHGEKEALAISSRARTWNSLSSITGLTAELQLRNILLNWYFQIQIL